MRPGHFLHADPMRHVPCIILTTGSRTTLLSAPTSEREPHLPALCWEFGNIQQNCYILALDPEQSYIWKSILRTR